MRQRSSLGKKVLAAAALACTTACGSVVSETSSLRMQSDADDSEAPAAADQAAAEAVALSMMASLGGDDDDQEESDQLGYGGPYCERPVRVSLDDDEADEFAIICSQPSSCGSFSQFFVVDLDAEQPVIHQSEEYYSAYFSQRIVRHDLNGDGKDEIMVASTSQDPEYGASVGLQVWQRRAGAFLDLWPPQPADWSVGEDYGDEPHLFTLDYEFADLDQDGGFDVIKMAGASQDAEELAEHASSEVWSWDEDGLFVRRESLDKAPDVDAVRQRWIERYAGQSETP